MRLCPRGFSDANALPARAGTLPDSKLAEVESICVAFFSLAAFFPGRFAAPSFALPPFSLKGL